MPAASWTLQSDPKWQVRAELSGFAGEGLGRTVPTTPERPVQGGSWVARSSASSFASSLLHPAAPVCGHWTAVKQSWNTGAVRLEARVWCAAAAVWGCTDRVDYIEPSADPAPPAEQGELLPAPAAAGSEQPAGGASSEPSSEQSAVLEITDASFLSGPSPMASATPPAAGALPEIVELTAPQGVTNGGAVLLHVTLEPPQAEPLFVVSVAGDNGYHTVRGTDIDGDGSYELELEVRAQVPAGSLRIAVAPTDGQGNVGAYRELTLSVVPSGVGDVKITLTFPAFHDLDLHVLEPGGFELSYLQPSSPSGGRLDLDSGSNCIPSVASAENVFWPTGAAPVGEYRVIVHEFEQCEPGAIDFTVRVENGALVETFHRRFADGAQGTSIEVTRFTH